MYYQGNDGIHKHSKHVALQGKKYVDKTSVHPKDCDCDVYCKILSVDKVYKSFRVEGEIVRSVDDMFRHLCAQMHNDWVMTGTQITKREVPLPSEIYTAIRNYKSASATPIPPLYPVHRKLKSSQLAIDTKVAAFYQSFDRYYMSRVLDQEVTYTQAIRIWQEVRRGNHVYPVNNRLGWPWVRKDNIPLTLKDLCLIKVSLFNQVYGGTAKGPNISYSMENVEVKLYNAIQKWDLPTHSMFGQGSRLAPTSSLVTETVHRLLDLEKYKGTIVFNYKEAVDKAVDATVVASSSGLRQGLDVAHTIDGVKYKVTPRGKKGLHKEYTRKQLMNMGDAFDRGERMRFVDKAFVAVPKNEVLMGDTEEEINKMMEKLRLVLISGQTFATGERVLFTEIQKLQRGRNIMVGCSFWSGGAERMAIMMHAGREGYTYFTFDIKSYDNSIKAQSILRYMYDGLYFINQELGDYRKYKALLAEVARLMVCRPVHVFEDIWVLLKGKIPSGIYITSSGGGYILITDTTDFFYFSAKQFAHMAFEIMKQMNNRDLSFICNGDNSCMSRHDSLKDVITFTAYEDFLSRVYGITMRDKFETREFFTLPNTKTGGIDRYGVQFLSRYFVKRETVTKRTDIATILPYRDFLKTARKYAFGDGSTRSPIDFVLAAIGMVYDSFGTNDMSYIFCRHMYDSGMKRLQCTTIQEMFTKKIQSTELECTARMMNSFMKKIGISEEELLRGFPTQDQLLDKHIVDPTKFYLRDESPNMEAIFEKMMRGGKRKKF
jgi:hypothetical protein